MSNKLFQIISGVGACRWMVRGPRRWDFTFWLGQSRILRINGGGKLIWKSPLTGM
jgi:hypothetical protein